MTNIVLYLITLGLLWIIIKIIINFFKSDLHSAVINGNVKNVEKHIAEGANVNATDKNGRTPLHMAASSINLVECSLNEDQENCDSYEMLQAKYRRNFYGSDQIIKLSEEITQILIKAGADVNAVDKNGRTPIRMAARYGNVAMVSVLIKAGADVNAADKNGRTPIRMATGYGYKVVVSMLIKAGADVNAADRYGSTPLHLAAEKGHKKVALLLVNAGADVNATDKFGRMPPSEIFSQ